MQTRRQALQRTLTTAVLMPVAAGKAWAGEASQPAYETWESTGYIPPDLTPKAAECFEKSIVVRSLGLGLGLPNMEGCIKSASVMETLAAAMLRLSAQKSGYTKAIAAACANAARQCAQECAKHVAHYPECQQCYNACRLFEEVCWRIS